MNKLEEQCYLAGYNGKKRPPWVGNQMTGLIKAYKAGVSDRKAGKQIYQKVKFEEAQLMIDELD